MSQEQKLINGKVWFLFDWCQTKEEAREEAKRLRNGEVDANGCKWFVRVIPAGDGYKVWRR